MHSIGRFSLLQALFWGAWATFSGFYVFFLREHGLSNTEIGLAMSTMMFMGVLGQTFWGYVCDRQQSFKRVFLFCMSVSVLVIWFFPYYQTALAVTIAMGVFGFVWMPQQAIIDSWIFSTSLLLRRRYGFIRSWGSLGYAFTVLIFGRVLDARGWDLMFSSHAFVAGLAMVLALQIKDSYREAAAAAGSGERKEKVNPLELFRISRYSLLLGASVLLLIPNRLAIQFMPEMMRELGGTAVHQGASMFVNSASEVPILITSSIFLTRFSSEAILLFSAVFFGARMVLLYFAQSPAAIIAASVFQGLSFGVYLPTVRYVIHNLAPDHLRTSAQTLATAAFFGLSSIITGILAGISIDILGMRTTLLYSSWLSGLAMILIFWQFLNRTHAGAGRAGKT